MYSSQQLAEGERAIKEVVQQIQHTYGDVVTFQVKRGADSVPGGGGRKHCRHVQELTAANRTRTTRLEYRSSKIGERSQTGPLGSEFHEGNLSLGLITPRISGLGRGRRGRGELREMGSGGGGGRVKGDGWGRRGRGGLRGMGGE